MQPVCSQQPLLHSYIHPAFWTHDKQGKQGITLLHGNVTAKNETFSSMEPKLVTTARPDNVGANLHQEERDRHFT